MIRTVQMLRFLSDAPLRGRATAEANTVEAFNGFSDLRGRHLAPRLLKHDWVPLCRNLGPVFT
ncbi:hypothetical protein DF268_45210 [Streptomyces sp. V2]|nr:hypothetical protein DF268_45210 [Streptomyces sp. V2]